jgi:hypothetical protein
VVGARARDDPQGPGDGVVLTTIHGRNEARSYAKTVSSWHCEQQLSPEEEDAISRARPRTAGG